MSKNEEIKKLVAKLLPMMNLKDKNYLIGILNGITLAISIQNQKESS